jgi:hypothetical protein
MKRALLGLGLLSLLGACESGENGISPAPAPKRMLTVEPRWELGAADAGPGITVRVTLGIFSAATSPQDCASLPPDLRIFVNDRPATIVDPGGPLLSGLSGTDFRYCKNAAFAEVGPFTVEALRDVRVRVEEAGSVAQAELGSVVVQPKVAPLPAQVKLGDVLSLPLEMAASPAAFINQVELEWQEGGVARRRGAIASAGEVDRIPQVRVVGGPGRVTVTVLGMANDFGRPPRCEGFSSCLTNHILAVGPLALDVLP